MDFKIAEQTTPSWSEELSRHFKEQLIYYKDIKPWKLYLRKILREHVQKRSEIESISELAKEFFVSKTNNQLLSRYFATTLQTATAAEITTEVENFQTNYRVMEDYLQITQTNKPFMADMLWVPTDDLNVEYRTSYIHKVSAQEFVTYWYRNVDKERKVPLFHLYRKRYYDYVRNDALHKTSEVGVREPKYMWRSVLKQMVKTGLVDTLYTQY